MEMDSSQSTEATEKKELETYKKIKLLGKGAHGKAFLVQCGSDKVRARYNTVELRSYKENRHQENESRRIERHFP